MPSASWVQRVRGTPRACRRRTPAAWTSSTPLPPANGQPDKVQTPAPNSEVDHTKRHGPMCVTSKWNVRAPLHVSTGCRCLSLSGISLVWLCRSTWVRVIAQYKQKARSFDGKTLTRPSIAKCFFEGCSLKLSPSNTERPAVQYASCRQKKATPNTDNNMDVHRHRKHSSTYCDLNVSHRPPLRSPT